jgi:hypothetical protein
MSTVFYILMGIIAFGACYAVYGLGVAIARLIRCRFVASEQCRAQQRRRAFYPAYSGLGAALVAE